MTLFLFHVGKLTCIGSVFCTHRTVRSTAWVCGCTDTSTKWICINVCHTLHVTRTYPVFFCQQKEHFLACVASYFRKGKQGWLFANFWDRMRWLFDITAFATRSVPVWNVVRAPEKSGYGNPLKVCSVRTVWHLGHRSSEFLEVVKEPFVVVVLNDDFLEYPKTMIVMMSFLCGVNFVCVLHLAMLRYD